MTRPRRQLLPENTQLHAHCVHRCVRRAFLCGEDAYTGNNFDHRKAWIEQRIALLAKTFAVSIHAWAVMSNHVHLVVTIHPATAQQWDDAEVAQRWCALYPPADATEAAQANKLQRLLANPQRIAALRQYLGSLSWLMKSLAEPIARRANAEDGCTGRFWEGRFKAQRLCDDKALLAAMAYVDLNPVRAGIADSLGHSKHTSIQQRLASASKQSALQPALGLAMPCPALTTDGYLKLVQWTGEQLRPDKRGALTKTPKLLGERSPRRWLLRVNGIESRYWRAVGDADDLLELAKLAGQRWLKGIGIARALNPET